MSSSLFVELPSLAILTLIVIHVTLRYYSGHSCRGEHGLHAFLLFSYFICILPVPLLLCDVQAAVAAKTADPTLLAGWTVLYWTTQALSWVVLPVSKSYLELGHLPRGRRLCGAVARNVKLYIAMAAVCGMTVTWVVIQRGIGSFYDVTAIAKAASNASGLVILTGLVGYGMVELPRYCFFRANIGQYVAWHEYFATKLWDAADTAQLDWADLQQEIQAVTSEVPEDHSLWPQVEEINRLVAEVTSRIQVASSIPLTPTGGAAPGRAPQRGDRKAALTEAAILGLHSRVCQAAHELAKTAYLWRRHRLRYYFLEDVQKAAAQPSHQAVGRIHLAEGRPGRVGPYLDWFQFIYWTRLRRWLLNSVGATLAVVSAAVLWSEVVTPIAPRWSLVAQSVAIEYGPLMQVTMFIMLAYIAGCAYWALFHLKLFDMYSLVAHYSHPAHLCWAGYNLCRLILPLCFNFLTIGDLTQQDPGESPVAFSRVFGNMAAIGLLGSWFRRWFVPSFLLAFAAFTFFHGFTHSLAFCALGSVAHAGNLPEDEVAEGKEILRNARRKDTLRPTSGSSPQTDHQTSPLADDL